MIGAPSQVSTPPVTTVVTCPTGRIHPAVIAQAAATCGVLLDGQLSLGIGSGDADPHVAALREYVDAGYDGVYVQQIGPDQERFFRSTNRQCCPWWGEGPGVARWTAMRL